MNTHVHKLFTRKYWLVIDGDRSSCTELVVLAELLAADGGSNTREHMITRSQLR